MKKIFTKHSCDICKKECEPVTEIRNNVYPGDGRDVGPIDRVLFLKIFHYNQYEDICKNCLIDFLREWLNNAIT